MNKTWRIIGIIAAILFATCQIATAGTVSGVVKDGNGNAISGATIKVYSVGVDGYTYWTATSDSNGNYSCTLYYTGYYTFSAQSGNLYDMKYYYISSEITAKAPRFTKPFLVSDTDTITINPVIDSGGGAISGKVLYSDGTPVISQYVSCYSPYSDGSDGNTNTSQDGTFTIGGLIPATHYTCYVYYNGMSHYYDNVTDWSKRTDIVVNANTTTGGIDFTLEKAKTTKAVVVIPMN